MSGKRRSRSRHQRPDDALERDVHAALESLGWVVPCHDADVAQAEAEPAAELPESLRDARAVFADTGSASRAAPTKLPYSGSQYIPASLARAAREGGRLTPETEAAMRRDREAAEREADQRHEDASE